jgi:hypothetical protein
MASDGGAGVLWASRGARALICELPAREFCHCQITPPIAFPLLRSNGVVVGAFAKPPINPVVAASADSIGECSRCQSYPLIHPMLRVRRRGAFLAQAKILVPTFVAINLSNKLSGRYGATRADQLSVNAVLNFTDATSLPRLMPRQIAPALDLSSLLLRRELPP